MYMYVCLCVYTTCSFMCVLTYPPPPWRVCIFFLKKSLCDTKKLMYIHMYVCIHIPIYVCVTCFFSHGEHVPYAHAHGHTHMCTCTFLHLSFSIHYSCIYGSLWHSNQQRPQSYKQMTWYWHITSTQPTVSSIMLYKWSSHCIVGE